MMILFELFLIVPIVPCLFIQIEKFQLCALLPILNFPFQSKFYETNTIVNNTYQIPINVEYYQILFTLAIYSTLLYAIAFKPFTFKK